MCITCTYQKLVQQKAILDRADNFPGGQTTEVTQLRQELLQVNDWIV